MQNFYLVRWLKENSGLEPDIIDSLKFELDKRLYYYGEQFAFPFEKAGARLAMDRLKFGAKEKILRYKAAAPRGGKLPRICSNAYFQFNKAVAECGFDLRPVPWQPGGAGADKKLARLISKINCVLYSGDFKDLITPGFAADVAALKSGLKTWFEREEIRALTLPFDMPFFERLAIKVFRQLGRPSFVALHGLPGRYNNIDDNRADYLLVWGNRIRDYYAAAGVPAEKIFVTGHPGYPDIKQVAPRFALDNVLVISKSMNGAQHSAEEVLSDRGNLVLYLYSIEAVLKAAGVERARLRLHPSESAAWYRRFLDGGFYTFDKDDLKTSLGKASLVIGPTSTVFLESLIAGVNYLIYEPAAGGLDLVNYPLVPPFDGSEPGVPAAHGEAELARLIEGKAAVKPGVLTEYIKPKFDTAFLQKVPA